MGDGLPEILAEGAQIGKLTADKNSKAIGWLGILTPTVSSPPVTLEGISFFLDKINDKGPGENASNIFCSKGDSEVAILSI